MQCSTTEKMANDHRSSSEMNPTADRLFVVFDIELFELFQRNVHQLDAKYSMESSNSYRIVLLIVLDYIDPRSIHSDQSFLVFKIFLHEDHRFDIIVRTVA